MRALVVLSLLVLGVACSSESGRTEENLKRTILGAREAYLAGDGDAFYEFLPLEMHVTCPNEVWDREFAEFYESYFEEMPPPMLAAMRDTKLELRDVRIEGDAATFRVVSFQAGEEVTINSGSAVWESGKWRGYPPDGDFGDPPCGLS